MGSDAPVVVAAIAEGVAPVDDLGVADRIGTGMLSVEEVTVGANDGGPGGARRQGAHPAK